VDIEIVQAIWWRITWWKNACCSIHKHIYLNVLEKTTSFTENTTL
jgi:hypothetical protein